MLVSLRFAQRSITGILAAACFSALLLAGCEASREPAPTVAGPSAATDAHDDHDHDHPAEGPHHGQLIELGNEEYHAEIVHTAGEAVTVYILDGSAKHEVSIAATEVTINLVLAGMAKQYQLTAAPDTNAAAGTSSRFVSDDAELGKDLDTEGITAKLAVSIDGKPYSGKIDHHHAHGDHQH